jgi:hypothetical protein
MFRIAVIFLLVIFQTFSVSVFSQVPVNEKLMVRISKEIWLGGTVHSSGFALNYGMSKFKNFKKKSLINIDLVSINHDKEYKIFGSFDENAKKFVFGKLNSLYTVRLGFGNRKILYEKLRENGLQITMNYTAGPSLGMVKPVFLEVFKYDFSGRIAGIASERYDPELHNFYTIYGRASWAAGLMETKINPGVFFKLGLDFDYSSNREIINSLEVGVCLDVFSKPVILMVENNNYRFYPSVYINYSIGNKFY